MQRHYDINKLIKDFGYLLVLGTTLGAVLVLGIIVAPVVFHTELLLFQPLDHYNAGIVMGEIFHRFSYWAYFSAIAVVVYEVLQYRAQRRDKVAMISSFIVLFTLLLFAAVYSPKILAMQALGVQATQSDSFAALHMASEIDFKILAVALGVLFVRRIMLLRVK